EGAGEGRQGRRDAGERDEDRAQPEPEGQPLPAARRGDRDRRPQPVPDHPGGAGALAERRLGRRQQHPGSTLAVRSRAGEGRGGGISLADRRGGGGRVRVKMILPALTEATSPLFRPIKYSLFPPLGLATLAAYLRDDDEVAIQDEHVERLDLDDEPELVVIQVYITSARRSYEIAD